MAHQILEVSMSKEHETTCDSADIYDAFAEDQRDEDEQRIKGVDCE